MKEQKLEERKMNKEEFNKLAERINFCARTIKAANAGELIVDITTPVIRYEIHDSGKIRIYRTLEELEDLAERMIMNRTRPSYNTRYTRSRRMASYVA